MLFCFPLHHCGAALVKSCLLLNCLLCCCCPCYNVVLFSAVPLWRCSANKLSFTPVFGAALLSCYNAVLFLAAPLWCCSAKSCLLLNFLRFCTAVPPIMSFCFLLHHCGAALLTSSLLLNCLLVLHCCPCYNSVLF
jgi:hypothetical protein